LIIWGEFMAKTILITGASTGLGAETARLLSRNNEIFVHYNASEGPARQVAEDVVNSGGKAHLLQADLTSEAGCRKLIKAVSERTEKLDVLFNNAGGLIRRMPAGECDWTLMQEVFALNTFSTMMVTALCIPLLEKGDNPCIVNVTSLAIRHGAPTATIYGAAKGAIDVFTRGAAKELAPGIRVNAIAPGVILTPFHDKVTTAEQLKIWQENTPLKRHGEAVHIARAVKFLIDNEFMTGETIDINGGLFMR
jgi:3-oxoacyl-[acyl-carrier protein] reductase